MRISFQIKLGQK